MTKQAAASVFIGSVQDFLTNHPHDAEKYVSPYTNSVNELYQIIFVPAHTSAQVDVSALNNAAPDQKILVIVQKQGQLKLSATWSNTVSVDARTHIVCVIEEHGSLIFFTVLHGELLSPFFLDIFLQGYKAHATVRGLYVIEGQQHASITVRQEHRALSTTSDVICKGVLADQSSILFKGTVVVNELGKNSSASLYNKNMLIGDKARALSMPQLEVSVNEVQCKHGSASSPYEKNQLMYLQSRGLCMQAAKRLLLASFVADCVQQSHMPQVDALLNKLTEK